MARRSFTIGEFSKMCGAPVRRLRFYADRGLFPALDRSQGNYRLFDESDLVRIEIIRALRAAGLGLDAIGEILARKRSLGDLLAMRLAEVEAEIAAQRRLAATIRAALKTGDPTHEDVRRIWKMTQLSQQERAAAINGFLGRAAEGAAGAPAYWVEWMGKMCAGDLPNEPTAEQIDAWIELSALMQDAGFVEKMRRNAADTVIKIDNAAFAKTYEKLVSRAKQALAEGHGPASDVGRDIGREYMEGWIRSTGVEVDAASLGRMRRKQLEHAPNLKRFWELVGKINGRPAASPSPEWALVEAGATEYLRTV